ncbi:hypothetical protein SAMN05216503_2192 [Polaribacter sp. KT25b]|uniref:hypothetical protein n=1 Tax=Polaribacter sp. KT25b TaxID=1855336 RepID=UPI00087B5B3D|nr:hypothetical protein [Polaribacter sp. KT25b]SDS16715.1 hypothetical protein SAMN05216503_2192 [Polaribacter sp. KT25b]
MKNKIILFILLVTASFNFFGQTKINDNEYEYETFKSLPQESIYIHSNTNFILTGEKLLYKVYTVNSLTKTNSSLSKIAYVELINERKESVLKQKIRLTNGIGKGDIFITSEIETGNYKLIGYTEWMKNNNLFFQESVTIINPFSGKIISIKNKTEEEKVSNNKEGKTTENNALLDLNLKSDTYGKRQKVVLKLSLKNKEKISGDFSVSVRQVNTIKKNKKQNTTLFTESLSKLKPTASNSTNTIYLPEFRGELISGKIEATNASIENIRIGLSLIQKNGIFKITNTDKNGLFYFNISEKYDSEKAYFQVLEDNKEAYSIKITENKGLNLNNLVFNPIEIDTKTNDLILERTAHIQIENAFHELKQDPIVAHKSIENVYENKFTTINLDDYTRFKTIRETMVEIIPNSWVTKNGDNYAFHVRDYNKTINYNSAPLLLIDGYIITNPNELIKFSSKKVSKISISQEIFKFNSKIYEGVIRFETYKGDYTPIVTKGVIETNITKPIASKEYYTQVYENNSDTFKRIPDYRTQLLWQPNLDLNQQEISFFTSDVSGDFEVSIEGFTSKGTPLSVKKMIYVK